MMMVKFEGENVEAVVGSANGGEDDGAFGVHFFFFL